ncbi:MAG: universal stress protein [Micropruina sp.]
MTAYVVVGVTPHQPDAVLLTAARFARRFEAELVCAFVVTGNYVVDEDALGGVTSRPVDADAEDWSEGAFDAGLLAELPRLLAVQPWSTRTLAGDPAEALARLADRLDAAMIVIGTHRPQHRRSLRDLLGASVGVHLAQRQHRPVVVVPLDPIGFG